MEYENEAYAKGYQHVCGVDEAGRGPLAGPVFAAAVVFPKEIEIPGLNDSKKLTEQKREELFDVIKKKALAYAIMSADEKTIDEINILNATLQTMQAAVAQLAIVPDIVFVDGNKAPKLPMQTQTIVKGDAKSASIAAASILAKVARDRYMIELSKQYPQYQFEKHKGYPTKLHYEMLDIYGVSPVHRKSFLKKYFKAKEQ